jgi:hypothetical protein
MAAAEDAHSRGAVLHTSANLLDSKCTHAEDEDLTTLPWGSHIVSCQTSAHEVAVLVLARVLDVPWSAETAARAQRDDLTTNDEVARRAANACGEPATTDT